MPFRSARRKESEISRFMADTNHDMMNLTKNLRDEMKLARKLSFRRIDAKAAAATATATATTSASLKPPPVHIQYPQIEEDSEEGSVSSGAVFVEPIHNKRHYPTLAEVSKLPSSRHFSKVLNEELDEYDDTPKKLPAITIPEEEEEEAEQEEPLQEDPSESYNDHHQPALTPTSHVEVEIFPGVFKHLRGSKETQDAWECGLCVQTPCLVCDAELAFIWDCEFVICPCCKAVVPVDASTSEIATGHSSLPSLQSSISSFLSETEHTEMPRQGGVGLGIRIL